MVETLAERLFSLCGKIGLEKCNLIPYCGHMSDTTVSDLIRLLGGPKVAVERAHARGRSICVSTVHKWRYSGIPEDHWPMFLSLEGVCPRVIYSANERARLNQVQRFACAS